MSDKPIVTVSVPNDQAKFESECAYWVANGYVLVSSSCATHGDGGAIDEMWLAVFALPSVDGRGLVACDHVFVPTPPHGYLHCKFCNCAAKA